MKVYLPYYAVTGSVNRASLKMSRNSACPRIEKIGLPYFHKEGIL